MGLKRLYASSNKIVFEVVNIGLLLLLTSVEEALVNLAGYTNFSLHHDVVVFFGIDPMNTWF